MLENIVEQIMLMKAFIVTAAVGTILMTVFFLVLCRKFAWTGVSAKFMGLFYELGMTDTFVLAVCVLKVFLITSLFFTKGRIDNIYIYFFGLLVILYNILNRRLKNMFVSLFNGAVIMGVLFVSNLLTSYLRDVLFDVKIAVALVLLAIFLILYACYDVAYCVLSIVERNDKERNTKRLDITDARPKKPEEKLETAEEIIHDVGAVLEAVLEEESHQELVPETVEESVSAPVPEPVLSAENIAELVASAADAEAEPEPEQAANNGKEQVDDET